MKGLEGSKLGRYELHHCIAQGGTSEVYLGYDSRVRRRVAIKVLQGRDEAFVRRFEREALAVGALSHEHILPLYDFGEQRPWYYLVMPFVEGGTLRDYLFQRGQLTLEEAGSFLEQLASALQYAHDHGVIHRDVKPSNVLLRLDGHAYLVDFGLARARIETGPLAHSHTVSLVGTPEYMAPEQLDGFNDHRSDLYSLGIVLYQMLTGHVPFTADSPVAVSLKHLQATPPLPRQFNDAIPPSIEEVILKALAKDVRDRYQEATALIAAYKWALRQERLQHHKKVRAAEKVEGVTGAEVALESDMIYDHHTYTFAKTASHPHLAPNDYPLSHFPACSLVVRRRRLRRAVFVICSLLLVSLLILLNLIWWKGPISLNGQVRPTTALSMDQRQVTLTAQAVGRSQATLVAQARVQATAGITAAITTGRLLYYSDLTSPGGGWLDDGDQCAFSPQGYQVQTGFSHVAAWCYTNQQEFSNGVISVQGQLMRGDFYGLVFRLDPYQKAFYVLEINDKGQYRLQRAQGVNPATWLTLIDWTSSTAIQRGYGHTNTFLVVATDDQFRFYINRQLIVSTFTDTAYAAGYIGVLVGGDSNGGTEAIFRHLGVFQK